MTRVLGFGAAALLAALSIGSQLAAANHFRIKADVGYMSPGKFGRQKFKVHEEVTIIVPAGSDCFLTPTTEESKTTWKCESQSGGHCDKPAIAVLDTDFPFESKLDHYRMIKPSYASASICNSDLAYMTKNVGRPVYIIAYGASSSMTDVIRIRTGKHLGQVKHDVQVQQKPVVSITFEKYIPTCASFMYEATGEIQQRALEIDPVPTDNLPVVWKFDEDKNVLARTGQILTTKLLEKGGGLCVSVLPYKQPCKKAAIKNGLRKLIPCAGSDQAALEEYEGWIAGTSSPDVRITRVQNMKKVPLTCAAIIIPGVGELRKPLLHPYRFRFHDADRNKYALQIERGVIGRRISTIPTPPSSRSSSASRLSRSPSFRSVSPLPATPGASPAAPAVDTVQKPMDQKPMSAQDYNPFAGSQD